MHIHSYTVHVSDLQSCQSDPELRSDIKDQRHVCLVQGVVVRRFHPWPDRRIKKTTTDT